MSVLTLTSIIIISIISNVIKSETFDCSTSARCSGSIICTENEDCYINCIGDYSCNGATVTCPQNAFNCVVVSDGSCASCNAAITGSANGGNLVITADGEGPHFPTVNCPNGGDCILSQDTGRWAWGAGSEIYAQNAKLLDISVTGHFALRSSSIWCPAKYVGSDDNNCDVHTYGSGYSHMSGLNIYAFESWSDVSLTCDSSSGCGDITMHCTTDYSESCLVSAPSPKPIINECDDTASVCHGYTLPPTPAPTADFYFDDISHCNLGSYTCVAGEDCYIECIGDSSCDYCNFYCPANYDCYVNAVGELALEQTNIYVGDYGNLILECSGGFAVCRDTIIRGALNGDITVTATGNRQTAFGIDIYGQDANSVTLTVLENLDWAIGYGTIWCPQSSASGSQNNCNVYIEGGSNSFHNAIFYAWESFTDINLHCDAPGGCTGAKIYCDVGFTDYCEIQLASAETMDEWECVPPSTSSCDGFTWSPTQYPTAPTSYPSKNPTGSPTNEPTTAPTQKPSDNPTKAPTDEPTQQPTDYPSRNPTEAPTKNPSNNPSEAPTDYPSKIQQDHQQRNQPLHQHKNHQIIQLKHQQMNQHNNQQIIHQEIQLKHQQKIHQIIQVKHQQIIHQKIRLDHQRRNQLKHQLRSQQHQHRSQHHLHRLQQRLHRSQHHQHRLQ
eukprot:329017_1